MSNYPGTNPPPYHEPSPQWAPPPYQPALYPSLPNLYTSAQPQVPAQPYYVSRTITEQGFSSMPPSYQPNQTYLTNHIYQGESSNHGTVLVVDPKDFVWIPATNSTAFQLADRAVIGGHEGHGSPLWVIRAKHNGYLIPGKFSVRNNRASIAYQSKEVRVQNIDVLCARPENVQWVPANRGNIPPNAVEGGRTMLGSVLYVGRAKYQQTLSLGNVNPKNKCCYIGFGGSAVYLQNYEVLCRIR